MRLAEKRDEQAPATASEDQRPDAQDGAAKAPPASLTATAVRRRHDDARDFEEDDFLGQGEPSAPLVEVVADDAPAHDLPPEPIGARAQQAILEQAFVEPAPPEAAPTIERTEFQSARDSAAQWDLSESPPPDFWERLIKDAAISIIVFAMLVFFVLQVV